MRRPIPVVTAREFAPVPLPQNLDTPRIRERLTAAALRVGVSGFETRGRRLHALGVVGVVDIGEVVVEILPKTNDGAARGDDVAFLGALFRYVGAPNDLGLSEAGVAKEGGDLLEIVFTWASRLAAKLLEEGPPRRYTVQEESSSAVRGRVELRHLVRQRPGRAFELTVRHAPLSRNNPVSRIIRWLIATLSERTGSMATRGRCLQLLDRLGGVEAVMPNLRDLDGLVPTPSEVAWAPLLALARLFLLQGHPDPTRGGAVAAIAVLVPLHGLFEAAVRRVLRDGLALHGLRLTRAGGALLRSDASGGLVDLRPDFLLNRDHTPVVVGDAKWKRIFNGDGAPQPTERDVYQLTAYVAAFEAKAGFIVAPLSEGPGPALRQATYRLRGLERQVDILGVRLPVLIGTNTAALTLRTALCRTLCDLSWPAVG